MKTNIFFSAAQCLRQSSLKSKLQTTYLAFLHKMLGGGEQEVSPPPGAPDTAAPKRGGGYGYNGSYPLNRAPGTFRNFNPFIGR